MTFVKSLRTSAATLAGIRSSCWLIDNTVVRCIHEHQQARRIALCYGKTIPGRATHRGCAAERAPLRFRRRGRAA